MLIKLLIIAITTLFMYRRTVHYGYVIDDLEVSTHSQTGKKWLDLWYQIRGHGYFNRASEHTITILLHTINSCLIYVALGSNWVSFITAMLFAVNPINNQASVWLSGKVYSAAATMVLIGMVFKPLFPLLYLAGFYFSLNVLLTPLLFLFLQPAYFAAVVALLPLFFYKRLIREPKRRFTQTTPEMKEVSWRKLIICFKTLGYYFRICVFPTRLGLCHEYLHVFGLSKKETEIWYTLDRYFWLGLFLALSVPVGLLLGMPVFGLFWFTVLIAQWCNFLVLNHPISERYAYLANIGVMYALATIFTHIPYGNYFALAFFIYYATKLWEFLPAYNTNLEFFQSNIKNFSNVAIGHNQMGLELIHYGKAGSAFEVFNEGLASRPADFRINYNLANLLTGLGRFQEAAMFVNRAEANLDINNNYELWSKQVTVIKDTLKAKGVKFN